MKHLMNQCLFYEPTPDFVFPSFYFEYVQLPWSENFLRSDFPIVIESECTTTNISQKIDLWFYLKKKECFSLKSEKRTEKVEFSIKMLRLNFLPDDFCVKMQKPQLQPVFFFYTGVCDLVFFPLFACKNVMYIVLPLNGITMGIQKHDDNNQMTAITGIFFLVGGAS